MHKLTASIAALLLGGLATIASAASYTLSGTHTYEIQNSGSPWNASVVTDPSTLTFTSGATPWQIDIGGPEQAPAINGAFHLAPYGATVDFGALGSAALSVPNRVITFLQEFGSPYYVAETRTLHVLTWPWLVTSPGQQCEEQAGGEVCAVLAPEAPTFFGDFTITFDDDTFNTFTGMAVVYQFLATGPIDEFSNCTSGWNACSKSTFVFTGTAVPVPASAWLMGSALVALAGAARRQMRRV